MTKVGGDITGVTSDRVLEGGGYVMKVGGAISGVMVMVQIECWNGGGYVTKVVGGVTGMMHDCQGPPYKSTR